MTASQDPSVVARCPYAAVGVAVGGLLVLVVATRFIEVLFTVYALLHHPRYRERYDGNLKRHLSHLPYASDFGAFVDAGEQLADLHVGYEDAEPDPLDEKETGQLEWRVEKMRWRQNKPAGKPDGLVFVAESKTPDGEGVAVGHEQRQGLAATRDPFASPFTELATGP